MLVSVQARAQQQELLAPAQVRPVVADIPAALDTPAADKVDREDIPAAGMDTRQVAPVEVVVRIAAQPAAPSVEVVDLRQASDARCSHSSYI